MAPGDLLEFLSANPLFAPLPAEALRPLASAARTEPVPARGYVFHEGDTPDWFCVMLSGRVKVLRHSRGGRDVVLEIVGPGEPFGVIAVIESRPYPASAQALEPSVVVEIPRGPILAVAERHPGFVKEVLRLVGRRLRSAHDAIASLAADPVAARLAAALFRLAERDGVASPDGLALPFHLTRQSLADMTGTTVETTIRILSQWAKAGLLVETEGRLALPDLERLRKLAGLES